MLGNEAEGGKGASLKEFLNADNQKEKTQTEQSFAPIARLVS